MDCGRPDDFQGLPKSCEMLNKCNRAGLKNQFQAKQKNIRLLKKQLLKIDDIENSRKAAVKRIQRNKFNVRKECEEIRDCMSYMNSVAERFDRARFQFEKLYGQTGRIYYHGYVSTPMARFSSEWVEKTKQKRLELLIPERTRLVPRAEMGEQIETFRKHFLPFNT